MGEHDKRATRRAVAGERRPQRHSYPPANLITSADLIAGANMPMQLKLRVTVRPGSRADADSTASGRQAAERNASLLQTRLNKHFAALLKWGKADRRNAALLLTDPVAAFARAGVELKNADRRRLVRQLDILRQRDALPPGVTLAQLDVTVATDSLADAEHCHTRAAERRRKRITATTRDRTVREEADHD